MIQQILLGILVVDDEGLGKKREMEAPAMGEGESPTINSANRMYHYEREANGMSATPETSPSSKKLQKAYKYAKNYRKQGMKAAYAKSDLEGNAATQLTGAIMTGGSPFSGFGSSQTVEEVSRLGQEAARGLSKKSKLAKAVYKNEALRSAGKIATSAGAMAAPVIAAGSAATGLGVLTGAAGATAATGIGIPAAAAMLGGAAALQYGGSAIKGGRYLLHQYRQHRNQKRYNKQYNALMKPQGSITKRKNLGGLA